MKQRFCEHCWYDVVRTTHPPASRGVIVGILFWPHKEPIRYRILAIFLAPTFGRYHLNWSGLSVNHLTLIRLAISGTTGRIENFKKNRALCNYLRPPSWLNEYSCLTFFTGRQVTEEVKKSFHLDQNHGPLIPSITSKWFQIAIGVVSQKLAGPQDSFGMLPH